MKKILVILLSCCAILLNAKNTYIPTYYTHISIEDNGSFIYDTSIVKNAFIEASDQRFSLYVLHDSLTSERVKAIKRQKAAIALSTIAAVAGAASAVVSSTYTPLTPMDAKWQAISYTNGLNTVATSTFTNYVSRHNLSQLEKLPISVVLTNNTEKEMYVNDMSRGLIWYIRAFGELTLAVNNPEINKFRIAYADTEKSEPAYIIIQNFNVLDEITIDYEDDECWLYAMQRMLSDGTWHISHYNRKNKQTMVIERMTISEAEEFIKKKKQEKRETKKKNK